VVGPLMRRELRAVPQPHKSLTMKSDCV
jgi:hypothetical protein